MMMLIPYLNKLSLFVGSDGLNHIKFNNFPNHNFNSGLVSLSDDNLDIIHHIKT